MLVKDEIILCQPIDDEGTPIKHPVWSHLHVVWMPIFLSGPEVLDMDRQIEVFTGKAMRACEGTRIERAATMWRKPWVMSFPVEEEGE